MTTVFDSAFTSAFNPVFSSAFTSAFSSAFNNPIGLLPLPGRLVRSCAIGLALAAALLIHSPVLAQLSDNAPVSTEGTDFVRPDVPAPPVKPRRPRQPLQPRVLPPIEPVVPAAVQTQPRPAPPAKFPSVVILLDTSDSMLNKVAGRDRTQLEEAKAALIQVVQGMSRETQVQLWVFNNRRFPVVVAGVAPGSFMPIGRPGLRKKLITKIRAIRSAGGTNLYQAITRTLDIFAAPADQPLYRSGQRFPVLVVISDGEDSGKTGHSLQSVLAVARNFPLVTINTIGFHISGRDKWFKQLCRISTRRDGCATAGNQARLQTILESFYRPRN